MKKFFFISILLISAALILPARDVKNVDKPLKGNWDFSLEKVWEIDSAGNDPIGRVFQIMVDNDGNLYVNDRSSINYKFSKDGKFIKSFAKKGEGPGEIIEQKASFIVNDTVIIGDRIKLHYLTTGGEFKKSVKNNYFKRTPVIFINENQFISAPYSTSHFPDGKGKILKINLETGQETFIAGFSLFKGGIAQMGGSKVVWVIKELSPLMILGYDNDRLYYGMNDLYKINVAELNGKILYTFSLQREKKKISPDFKKGLFSPTTLPGEVIKTLINSHPDEVTYFTNIEIHNKHIYVFLADLEHRYQKEIDIFSLDGKYQYRSCISFDKNLHILPNRILIKKNNLYVALGTEDGDIKIVKYKITVPN